MIRFGTRGGRLQRSRRGYERASCNACCVAAGVLTWSLMRVEPVSAHMAGPSAAALIRSGACATGYAVRVPGTTTVSREPVIHRRPAESMMRAGADMALEA